VMQTNGELKIVALSKSAYRELGSATLLPGTTRALPALSNGRFYVRNENTLKCVSLGRAE
jgi:outer membrane protein assembly factor BamB